MANFDPQVPESQPGVYIGWSKTAKAPEANVAGQTIGKSVGSGLSQSGQLFEEGAQNAYRTQEADMKSQLHQQYDPVQKGYIDRLSQLDDVLQKPGYESLLSQAPQNYPPEIQKMPGMVDNLISMRDNGKVSSTYIDMTRDTIAKNLRAKYPGMRDVIDQEFTRMTREDPANKVMQQLTEDINSYASAAREAKDKVGNKLLEGVGAGELDPKIYYGYQKGLVPQEAALTALYRRKSLDANNRSEELSMGVQIKKHELDAMKAGDVNNDFISREAYNTVGNMNLTIPGFQSHNIGGILSEIASGKELDQGEARLLAQTIEQSRAAFITNTLQKGMQPLDPNNPNSPTRSTAQGGEAYTKAVQEKADAIFGTMGRLFTDKDKFGLGYSLASRFETMQSQMGMRVMQDHPELGYLMEMEKLFGPQSREASDYLHNMMIDPKITNDLKPYGTDQLTRMATQPDVKRDGTVFTIGSALDESARKGLNGPEHAALNNGIVSGLMYGMINTKMPPQVRSNAMDAAYWPTNHDIITKVNPSDVSDQGVIGPGKSTLLSQTVNHEATKTVAEKGTPQQIENYKDYTTASVANTIVPEVATLSRIAEDPSIQYFFNPVTGQFSYKVKPLDFTGVPPRGFSSDNPKIVQKAITKINLALRSYMDVNERLIHGDVSAFLADFLMKNELGSSPLIKAIIAANQQEVSK